MTDTMEENLANLEAYLAGEDDGIEKGIKQNQLDVVKNMYQDHVNSNTIAKYCNLSIDKVKDIISNIKNEKRD